MSQKFNDKEIRGNIKNTGSIYTFIYLFIYRHLNI